MMRAIAVVVLGGVSMGTGCFGSTPHSEVGKVGAPGAPKGQPAAEVQVWGSLRSVMHEGKTEGNVALSSVAPGPHAFAVGALSGLRGEVTVIDDDLIVSLGDPAGGVRTLDAPPPGEQATLLVRAVVPRWSRHIVDHAIEANRIDGEIEGMATSSGLDVETRIPVVIEATAKNLEWHVLGGSSAAGHSAHDGPRSKGTLSGVAVTLVGFFSRHDQAVFTHMSEQSHFHVVTKGERMTGHVDSMELEPGAVIRLPVAAGRT